MAIDLLVTVEDDRWRQDCRDIEAVCRAAATAAWQACGDDGRAELTVVLSDDDRVRDLNARFRGRDKPTNVLAFDGAAPPPGLPRPVGDIILAYGTVAGEARDQAKTLAAHASHLAVHGLLHLLGHDHDQAESAAAMEALETEILAGLGVDDPYRDIPVRDTVEAAP